MRNTARVRGLLLGISILGFILYGVASLAGYEIAGQVLAVLISLILLALSWMHFRSFDSLALMSESSAFTSPALFAALGGHIFFLVVYARAATSLPPLDMLKAWVILGLFALGVATIDVIIPVAIYARRLRNRESRQKTNSLSKIRSHLELLAKDMLDADSLASEEFLKQSELNTESIARDIETSKMAKMEEIIRFMVLDKYLALLENRYEDGLSALRRSVSVALALVIPLLQLIAAILQIVLT